MRIHKEIILLSLIFTKVLADCNIAEANFCSSIFKNTTYYANGLCYIIYTHTGTRTNCDYTGINLKKNNKYDYNKNVFEKLEEKCNKMCNENESYYRFSHTKNIVQCECYDIDI